MFGAGGSNPFGQSSSSPFGSQSVFGQTSSPGNNPFAPKPFGSTTPFGSQTGTSIFGGTATGMFGASSAFPSSSAFGASSSPAFGGSTPAFGASSSPAFGGSSVFGQKPAFGGFGPTTQSSPFGSQAQPSQPAFGSGLFGSTSTFGAPSQPAFGSSSASAFGSGSTPAFGATSAPAFGATSTPAFGATSTPAFGATTAPAFGATTTPTFGATTGPAFGATTTPAFGATTAPAFGSTTSQGFGSTGSPFGASSTPSFGAGGAFGSSNTSIFGSSSTPAFGASSTPAFGASSTPGFGASTTPSFSSTPSFSFGSSAGFGQSTSPNLFGTSTNTFGAPSSPFGAAATTPTFGTPGFGQPSTAAQRGSRVVPYTPTAEAESTGQGAACKLESISAMSAYKEKSHEELRWEDYQLGDKGGLAPPGQSTGGVGFNTSTQSNPFSTPSTFSQPSTSNIFSTSNTQNPFAKPAFGSTSSTTLFAPSTASNPFQTTTTNVFSSNSSSSLFSSSSLNTFSSTPSLFPSSSTQVTSSPFSSSLFSTSSAPQFPSTTPSLAQTGSGFGPVSSFASTTTPLFQSNPFSSPSTGFASTPSLMPSTIPSFAQTSQSLPFQLSQPPQSTGQFNFNFATPQSASTGGFAPTPGIFGPSNLAPLSTTQSCVAVQTVPVTNPFGTLPVMPQVSIARAGTTPSIQYGISSMPVVEKPATVRISSLVTARYLSQRRSRPPARKYDPKHNVFKVPFFSDEEETPSTPKADALFIPRENPRALVIRPVDQRPLRAPADRAPPLKDVPILVHGNGKNSEARDDPLSSGSNAGDKDKPIGGGGSKERAHEDKSNVKSNGVNGDHSFKEDSYMNHRAGEAAIVYEHGADIEALMPKLRSSDYYTEPRIQELAAKERAEPGFCRHVKDFVVGRHGYGSIKFFGETDVRRLDLESLVQFNSREVIVYMDDGKKPPVGQGLNKPAEVMLLNIKCIDKKTGRQYTEGPKIEKYKEMLKRKTEDQGAEFVSYDPVKGEWKFRVSHFSYYRLEDDEEDDVCEDVHAAGGF